MLKDLASFSCLYGLIFWIFLVIGLTLLVENEEFQSIWTASVTLIEWSLGNFDVQSFTAEIDYINPTIAELYMFTFLILNIVTLLNFVIAILSNTYVIIS